MNEGDSWDSVPADLLEDCAQLTKANSIDGMFSTHFFSYCVCVPFHLQKIISGCYGWLKSGDFV
jgi:hypothetical protein